MKCVPRIDKPYVLLIAFFMIIVEMITQANSFDRTANGVDAFPNVNVPAPMKDDSSPEPEFRFDFERKKVEVTWMSGGAMEGQRANVQKWADRHARLEEERRGFADQAERSWSKALHSSAVTVGLVGMSFALAEPDAEEIFNQLVCDIRIPSLHRVPYPITIFLSCAVSMAPCPKAIFLSCVASMVSMPMTLWYYVWCDICDRKAQLLNNALENKNGAVLVEKNQSGPELTDRK